MDDVGRYAPALPTRLEIFNNLVDGSDKHVRARQDLVSIKLGPAARHFLGRAAAIVRHGNPLHQGIQLQPRKPVLARNPAHEPHPLVDTRHPPPGEIGRNRAAAPEGNPREADDVGLPRGEREKLPAVPPIRIGGWGRWTGRGSIV